MEWGEISIEIKHTEIIKIYPKVTKKLKWTSSKSEKHEISAEPSNSRNGHAHEIKNITRKCSEEDLSSLQRVVWSQIRKWKGLAEEFRPSSNSLSVWRHALIHSLI